jgi:DNA-binding transcriptional ArsR family regulator
LTFSPAFITFVRENIVSVEQIHVLLLLSEQRERSFSVDEISAELTSTPRSIRERLRVLRRRRLVERAGERYRYVADAVRDLRVDELREAFANRPVSVIELIFSRREDSLESFADAFLLGGDDDDRG